MPLYLVAVLIHFSLGGEGVSLLMVQIFLKVEECVKENRSHFTALQVLQCDFVQGCRSDHIQHLKKHILLTILRASTSIWITGDTEQIDIATNCLYLTKTVVEGQGLDAELLHALQLLLVEELELVHGEDAVPVQVHAAEPVLDGGGVPLVLLRHQEPHELGVGHPPLLLRAAPRHRAREYPLDHAGAQRCQGNISL